LRYIDDICTVDVVSEDPFMVLYVAFHMLTVDTMILEFTVTTWETFTVDAAIVEVVRVDPVSVEKNPLFKYMEEIVAVDVVSEDPFMVLYVAFHIFTVDAVILEFTVSATDKFMVDPAIVLKVRVDPVSVEKNPLFTYIEETVTVDVNTEDPVSVENCATPMYSVEAVTVDVNTEDPVSVENCPTPMYSVDTVTVDVNTEDPVRVENCPMLVYSVEAVMVDVNTEEPVSVE